MPKRSADRALIDDNNTRLESQTKKQKAPEDNPSDELAVPLNLLSDLNEFIHNGWSLLESDKLELIPQTVPLATANWTVIHRSHNTNLKSFFLCFFPIDFWDQMAFLVSNNMVSKVTTNMVGKCRSKYYKQIRGVDLIKWYAITLLLENKFSAANSDIDEQFQKVNKKRETKAQQKLPIGVNRYHAVLSCFFGDDVELQSLFSKLRNAWQNCFTPNDKGVCDEIVYEYKPRKDTKKAYVLENTTCTFSLKETTCTYVTNLLKRNTRIEHWSGAVNSDGVLISYYITRDDKTDEIRGHSVMINGFSVNAKDMTDQTDPGQYSEEKLNKMKLVDFKILARQKGIKPGSLNKVLLVKKMLAILNKQETTLKKLLSAMENQNFSGKPDHHSFYRSHFNAVDLHDRRWYKFTFHVKNWRCKMLL